MAEKRITATTLSRDLAKILRKQYPMLYKDVDIEEGFERPCMTMEVGDIESGAYNEQIQRDEIPMVIYYFSKDRRKSYIDLLEKQESLRRLLESPLLIGGCYLYPSQELDFSVIKSDGALIAEVTYELLQDRVENGITVPMHPDEPLNNEPLEELEINLEME